MKKIFAIIIFLPIVIFGAEWQSLNGPPAGRADDLSMGLYEGVWVIYAADQTHKLYKSTNEGESWDSLPPPAYPNPNIINPTCVITEPNNAQVVYIGKHDATSVWKSTDGGATWEPKSTGIINTRPLCFAMAPNNPSVVYLGCKNIEDKPVLFRTTDGGFEWRSLNLTGYDINDVLVLEFSNEGSVLILATDKGLLRGRPYYDFKLVKAGAFELLRYDQKNLRIFARGKDAIYQSGDGGKKWRVYKSDEPIDFSGISDIIKRRQ